MFLTNLPPFLQDFIPDGISDLIQLLVGCIVLIGFITMTIVEKSSKFKALPWTRIANGIKKALGISEVIEGQKEMKSTIDRHDAETRRRFILAFGDEVRRHVDHSEKNFEQVLEDIQIYNAYCKDHPEFKNGRTEEVAEIIVETYKQCYKDNSFL